MTCRCRRKGKCNKGSTKVTILNIRNMKGTLSCCKMCCEGLNDKRPAKDTLAFRLKNKPLVLPWLWEGNTYLSILGSDNFAVEKCIGFQSRFCKFLTAVIGFIIVVIEESINNGQGSRSKAAAPFTNTLIGLDKGVISVLLKRRMGMPTRAKTGPVMVIMWGTLSP